MFMFNDPLDFHNHFEMEIFKCVIFGNCRDLLPLSIELDALGVVQLCNSSLFPRSELGCIIDEIRLFCSAFDLDSISHVSHNCNKVAHGLARHALSLDCSAVWDVSFPNWLSQLAQGDLCVVSRP
ncbi:hypothetical protein JRO89_XS07G0019600 [Xanthoceras sorbifolium]|uniref:RNase H type-1 domain-containing protein n=1 Tax=Xanthoceras sorbifolium TaxID=99658 RepID=A0ABQ8HS44_9ROSI|nr:hypothetical protein JRO89_XS07G0019600 [Xanthoceras sorbifolium]